MVIRCLSLSCSLHTLSIKSHLFVTNRTYMLRQQCLPTQGIGKVMNALRKAHDTSNARQLFTLPSQKRSRQQR